MRRTPVSPNHPSNHHSATGTSLTSMGWRTLHLVDVDNLLGDPGCAEGARIRRLFDAYREVSSFRHGDHVVVATGCNARHALAVEIAWPNVCHRRRAGRDGADMALLEESEWAAVAGRFGRVVIGSGDRIFLAAMDRLRAADISVDFVARRRSLATAIAVRAGDCISYLPEPA